ncbi:MAG: hypothetical protein KME35_12980 [Aphanocapsa sp. GSE-SYN-MK-11-07L]|nr:hypothetical protein [Aphanocapsa sp. GSE-SYN-MK-11-07L]
MERVRSKVPIESRIRSHLGSPHNNPNARRPPRGYRLGVQGDLRRVMGNVMLQMLI